MKAVILAAGLGTRLRSVIGENLQKTMMRYGNTPLLERTIRILKEKNITDIVIVVSYLKEQIMNYFGDGKKFGVRIEYVLQKNPKGGTADATYCAKEKISDEKFLLIYGDNIFHPATLEKLLSQSKNFDGVLAVKEVEDPSKFGVIELDGIYVKKIHEKPSEPPTNLALTGLFILPREIFEAIEKTPLSSRGEYELTDSIQLLCDAGKKIGHIKVEEFWFDPRDEKEIELAKKFLNKT
jgi:dTDP-glucose pyrophosphorylase